MEETPPALASAGLSLVTDYGEAASTCGYCRSAEETSWSHGMQADFLTPETYQELLDRWGGRWQDGRRLARTAASPPWKPPSGAWCAEFPGTPVP